jgi:uncharacterized protein (DUF302 family)
MPAFEVELPLAEEAAVARVTGSLKAEGFGVITRIDARAIFDEKLGVSFRPYTILGACNPALAHRALLIRPELGLLLPCNVTVEQTGEDRSLVRILDPAAMLKLGGLKGDQQIEELMTDAGTRLQRVAADLLAHADTKAL